MILYPGRHGLRPFPYFGWRFLFAVLLAEQSNIVCTCGLWVSAKTKQKKINECFCFYFSFTDYDLCNLLYGNTVHIYKWLTHQIKWNTTAQLSLMLFLKFLYMNTCCSVKEVLKHRAYAWWLFNQVVPNCYRVILPCRLIIYWFILLRIFYFGMIFIHGIVE